MVCLFSDPYGMLVNIIRFFPSNCQPVFYLTSFAGAPSAATEVAFLVPRSQLEVQLELDARNVDGLPAPVARLLVHQQIEDRNRHVLRRFHRESDERPHLV